MSPGMRVVAGTARGRRLAAPSGTGTRPTSDRVRESVFNMLHSLGAVEGARVLDLFAGTGALAIEALSRGAAGAVLVERDPGALTAIRANLAATGLGPARVVAREVLGWLRDPREQEAAGLFDLAFADPPYDFRPWPELLAAVPSPLLVAESDREVGPVEGWSVLRSRRYGGTVVEVLERGRSVVSDRSER